MASRTGALLEERAQQRKDKRDSLLNARKTNLQSYVQMVSDSAAPRTLGSSNRALPQTDSAPPQRQSSRLTQEMASMSSKLNSGQDDKRRDKEKETRDDARSQREGDQRQKQDSRNQQENGRNFDTLGKVFKTETNQIVEAIDKLNRNLQRQAAQNSGGGGGGGGGKKDEPSLLDQLDGERKKKRDSRRAKRRARLGGPPSAGDIPGTQGNDLDLPGDPPSRTDRGSGGSGGGDDRRARRMERLRTQRAGGGRGLRGAMNRVRGFGGSLFNRAEGMVESVGGSKVGRVLGGVGGVLAAGQSIYDAAPLVGKVFDSDAQGTDRAAAGAHLAVQGAGTVIGGVLGGAQGAAYGSQIGDQAANIAEKIGQQIADKVDVYGMVNDKDGAVQKTMGAVGNVKDAIVGSDVGKSLGMAAAVAMAPFSSEAREALKKDWEQEIIPKFSDKFDTLKSALGNYATAVGKAGSDILDGLKGAGKNVIDGLSDAGNQIAEGYKKNGIVGALEAVPGTASKVGAGISKAFGSAAEGVSNAGSSLRYGAQKGTANTLDLAMGFSADKGFKGMNDSQSKAYAANVMKTESGGALGITNQYGFAGQYQFGADALADNGLIDKDKLAAAKKDAKANGKDWYKGGLHKKFMEDNSNWKNEGGETAFLNDKKLQDDTFVKYTDRNITAGYKSGALTADSTPEDIAAYAKAAHLKGTGGANDYILRGKDSADANGTKVSDYANGAAKSMTSLAAQVDEAKKNGMPMTDLVAKAGAKSTIKPLANTKLAGQVAVAKKEEDKPTLKEAMDKSDGSVRSNTSNVANAERKADATATASTISTGAGSPDASTATASAQPIPMLDTKTPPESQRVTVTNPSESSGGGKTTVVQGGNQNSGTLPTLDEIPMTINDMGLVLLNIGHI